MKILVTRHGQTDWNVLGKLQVQTDILGNFFESEVARTDKYYRVIQTIKEYSDGRRFPLNEKYIN